MTEIDNFMPLLMQREEEGALAPLLSHGRVHFLWIKHSNLYRTQPRRGLHICSDSGGNGDSWGGGRGQWSSPPPSKSTFSLTLLTPVVATTLKNANASLVYSFLYKTVEVGTGRSLAGWSVSLPFVPSPFQSPDLR
jgi:AP-1 complex subunit mu